ncbi:MAG: hypothetical protein NVS1B11_01130 [Terriglobales bacterium]
MRPRKVPLRERVTAAPIFVSFSLFLFVTERASNRQIEKYIQGVCLKQRNIRRPRFP